MVAHKGRGALRVRRPLKQVAVNKRFRATACGHVPNAVLVMNTPVTISYGKNRAALREGTRRLDMGSYRHRPSPATYRRIPCQPLERVRQGIGRFVCGICATLPQTLAALRLQQAAIPVLACLSGAPRIATRVRLTPYIRPPLTDAPAKGQLCVCGSKQGVGKPGLRPF